MLKSIFILIGLLSASQLAFSVDKFNAYQWNRENPAAIATDTSPWFEWWYYKVVLPDTGKSYFFLYGVVNPWDTNYSQMSTRSYVGFGDFEGKQMIEQKYPVTNFSASYDDVSVRVGTNSATDKQIQAKIVDEQGQAVSWNVSIDKRWAFNATSWATGRNITNIEWYPAQADARCSGEIVMAQETVTFKDAPCYQDRNWGRSFPKWWTWIVSNHFEDSPGTALAIGGGRPKYLGLPLPYEGVAIGLNYQGEEITFRPNDLNPVFIDVEFGNWYALGYNGKYKIEISAKAEPGDFLDLQFQTPEGDLFHDYETLTGEVIVKLFRKKGLGWQPVTTLYSQYAGIEFGSTDVSSFENIQNSHVRLYRSSAAEKMESGN